MFELPAFVISIAARYPPKPRTPNEPSAISEIRIPVLTGAVRQAVAAAPGVALVTHQPAGPTVVEESGTRAIVHEKPGPAMSGDDAKERGAGAGVSSPAKRTKSRPSPVGS